MLKSGSQNTSLYRLVQLCSRSRFGRSTFSSSLKPSGYHNTTYLRSHPNNMEHRDTLIEIACTAFRAIANVAQLAADSNRERGESPRLLDIAARLLNAAETLDQPHPGHKCISTEKIVDVLGDLERVCRVATPKSGKTTWNLSTKRPVTLGHFPLLNAISNQEIALEVVSPSLFYLARRQHTREKISQKLARIIFIKKDIALTVPDVKLSPKRATPQAFEQLHATLARYQMCICPCSDGCDESQRKHRIQLKLTRESSTADTDTSVDTAFRVAKLHSSGADVNLTFIRVRVPRKVYYL